MKDYTATALQYCLDITSGKIPAGPYVVASCQRHLDDLEHGHERGLYYDEHAAIEAIAFFEEILFLNGDDFEGLPFLLDDWEAFIVSSLFAWKYKKTGYRRFRLAYIETAKGSGKSPLAAGIAMKGFVADGVKRAEIYACATMKEQAQVLFRDAVAFCDQSPALQKRVVSSGGAGKEWKLYHPESGSFFQIISSDKKKSGPRPHMYVADELHEHVDGTIVGQLEKGFKSKKQPLGVEITNAGFDTTSFCWERHEMGVKVATGLQENDSVFSYICALDEEDLKDEAFLKDESVWCKVNPSLDGCGIPGYDYIRKQVQGAEGMPSQLSLVKRLNFCVWTEADNPWISGEQWNPCKDSEFDEELLKGRKCTVGQDLSAVNDLTSLTFLFYPTKEDPFYRLLPFFWVPEEGLRRKAAVDHVPYDVWVRQGHLFTSPGPTIQKTQVVKFLYDCSLIYDIQGVAHDRDRMADFREFAQKAEIEIAVGKWDKEKREWDFDNRSGIKMMPFGQTAKSMAPAIDKFEGFLFNKEIRHNGNPVLTWCMSNAVVKADDDNYRKISKRKSIGRVDGAVTTVMAAGISERTDEAESAYANMTKKEMIDSMAF